MKVLLVADGRSTITRSWMRILQGLEMEIRLVSTFPCELVSGVKIEGILPVGFSAFAGGQVPTAQNGSHSDIQRWIAAFRPLFLRLRAFLTPLTLVKHRRRLTKIAAEVHPDLVHALRVPFEGMLAAALPREIPLVISIWGNDLTFHACTSPLMVWRTRETLRRADGLMADAQRDIRLAREWGLRGDIPSLVVPGSGGLDLEEIRRVIQEPVPSFTLPENMSIVVNPRGFRPGSVHQDVFFRSIPLVLKQAPDTFFVCTAMRGQREAEKWVHGLGIEDHVLLLPYLEQHELWRLFSRASVYVSLSSHDGTPNTFLEALACGCFPVVGDIESLREWLADGENGLLVHLRDSAAAAQAIVRALKDAKLREQADRRNIRLIRERANLSDIRKRVSGLYKDCLKDA